MSVSFPRALAGILIALIPITALSANANGGSGGYATEVPKSETIDNKDGTALASDNEADVIPVAEELDFVRENGFRDRGAFDGSLKKVTSVNYYGTRSVGAERFQLEVDEARPDSTRTLLKSTDAPVFEIRKSAAGISSRGAPRGLSVDEERALAETFEFDSPINALEKNDHAYKPLGMLKLPGILTWKLEAARPGKFRRIVYIDSHTGDVVRTKILDANGSRIVDFVLHDFRSVDGIRVPFAVDYRGSDGNLLASDRIERVEVKRSQS
jgi:hypothetical protein